MPQREPIWRFDDSINQPNPTGSRRHALRRQPDVLGKILRIRSTVGSDQTLRIGGHRQGGAGSPASGATANEQEYGQHG